VDVDGTVDAVGVNAKGWMIGDVVRVRVAGVRWRAYQQVGSEQGVTIGVGIGITVGGRGITDVGQGGCQMGDGTVRRWERESEHVHQVERRRSRCTAPRRGQWAVVGDGMGSGTCRAGQGAKDVLRA
jgi:hypothetical protein